MTPIKNIIGEEYDELKAYCAVLENENDILADAVEQKNIEIEKLTKIIRAVEVIMGGKILDD